MWNQFAQLMFGATLVTTAAPLPPTPTTERESAAHLCARSVSQVLDDYDQAGPVFHRDELSFTSIEANDHSRILILNAGTGFYALPLKTTGVQWLRFFLPTAGETKEFFLAYLDDGHTRPRVFNFAINYAPAGKSEDDFNWVTPVRAEHLAPHFEYNLFVTSENMQWNLLMGKTDRMTVRASLDGGCDTLATNLRNRIQSHLAKFEPPLAGRSIASVNNR